MGESGQLSEIQSELAAIFFSLVEAADFLVAGGAALLASGLINRPTHDLDLFAAAPTIAVTPAKEAFVKELHDRGYDVVIVQESDTFCRLVISRAQEETLVDLAVDSPPLAQPVVTLIGPTFSELELAGRKLLALFGRAEARDFADVYRLVQLFGKEPLLGQARLLDAGFNAAVLAQMMATLGRFDDFEIPLGVEEVPLAREFFNTWAVELGA